MERDYVARPGATPNDPYLSTQWHISKIQAPNAWNVATGSPGITIAVIDSGVETTHPDLVSKLVPGWNFLSGTSAILDTMGHGTGTAGTAAAATNNANGVAGVGWGNTIMPLIVVDSSGSASYSNMASAITYAADHGARVINMSLAGTFNSSTLQSAINYAWNKGVVVVAAAGNSATSTPYYPAACDNVVAVSATDSGDAFASFSNFGPWIDLAAPGVNVFTTGWGASYSYRSGTSFSSPVVAGVAALVFSARPSLAPASVVSILTQNADDLGAPGVDDYFGNGRVNAYRAVTAAQSTPSAPPPTVSITSPANGATVSGNIFVQGTVTSTLAITSTQFLVDSVAMSTGSGPSFSFPWNTTTFANGWHTITVNATDSAGNTGSSSISVNINNPVIVDSVAPTVAILKPANGAAISGQVQITTSATDNIAVTQVSFYIDGTLKCTDLAAPYSCNWNSKKASRGTHTINATAWDAAGNSASASIAVVK